MILFQDAKLFLMAFLWKYSEKKLTIQNLIKMTTELYLKKKTNNIMSSKSEAQTKKSQFTIWWIETFLVIGVGFVHNVSGYFLFNL